MAHCHETVLAACEPHPSEGCALITPSAKKVRTTHSTRTPGRKARCDPPKVHNHRRRGRQSTSPRHCPTPGGPWSRGTDDSTLRNRGPLHRTRGSSTTRNCLCLALCCSNASGRDLLSRVGERGTGRERRGRRRQTCTILDPFELSRIWRTSKHRCIDGATGSTLKPSFWAKRRQRMSLMSRDGRDDVPACLYLLVGEN